METTTRPILTRARVGAAIVLVLLLGVLAASSRRPSSDAAEERLQTAPIAPVAPTPHDPAPAPAGEGDGAGVPSERVATVAAPRTPATSLTEAPPDAEPPPDTEPPPPPPPSTSCGGPVAGDGGEWQCTFDDEFDGGALDLTKWTPQRTATSAYHSGLECFVDSPNNINVADGLLNLTVRTERSPLGCGLTGLYTSPYTSGMVSTFEKFSQAYGRFEIRAKVPGTSIPGLQESFWLWPVDSDRYGSRWPASGEIDIAEIYSQYADRAIPYIHYRDGGGDPNVTSSTCYINDVSQLHTYALEWTPSTMTISYDGQTCIVDSWTPSGLVKPAPFDQPFIISLTQALGVSTNAFRPGRTPLPATTSVDYVRVWKWVPAGG